MDRRIRPARNAALVLAALSLAGCAGMGTVADVLGGLPGSQLSGEIRRVDERRQEILLRTSHGRSETVDYDRETRVLYGQRRYPVRALEPGDEVSIQLRRSGRGDLRADYVRVERSVRDRRDSRYPAESRDRSRDWERERDRREDRDRERGSVWRLEGRVGRIDRRAGWFELRSESRGSHVVTLSRRTGSSSIERFRRLRSGDRVRLEGRVADRGRVELLRFR